MRVCLSLVIATISTVLADSADGDDDPYSSSLGEFSSNLLFIRRVTLALLLIVRRVTLALLLIVLL